MGRSRAGLPLLALLAGACACGRGPFVPIVLRACDEADGSLGCRFGLARFLHRPRNETDPDGLVVANPGEDDARVRLSLVLGPDAVVERGEIVLAPGQTHRFELLEGYAPDPTSMRDDAGTYRVEATAPVSVQLFSPLTNRTANDASLVLPVSSLGTQYVVPSYRPFEDPTHFDSPGTPSYFTVVAMHDDTVVRWRAPVATAGASGVPATAAGEQGSVTLAQDERLRVAAADPPSLATSDISGAVVFTSRPALVVGAVGCAYVPDGVQLCDHLQEALLPTSRWGTEYVAAPAPRRGTAPTIWRIFAGAQDVAISADPPVAGFPFTLPDVGSFVELSLPVGVGTVLRGDGPFMPVQYLASRDLAGGRGDPAMAQVIPVSAWPSTYLVDTPDGFEVHILELVRRADGGPVEIDGERVDGWQSLGAYEVVDVEVEPGPHHATSDEPFALTSYGWSNGLGSLARFAAYAVPGGITD